MLVIDVTKYVKVVITDDSCNPNQNTNYPRFYLSSRSGRITYKTYRIHTIKPITTTVTDERKKRLVDVSHWVMVRVREKIMGEVR